MARPKRATVAKKATVAKNPEVPVESIEPETVTVSDSDTVIQEAETITDVLVDVSASDALAAAKKQVEDLQKMLADHQAKAKEYETISNGDFDEDPEPGKFFYYKVKFHPKRNENDTNEASQGINGKFIQWPRGVVTAIRSDYRRALEHAFTPRFKVLPGMDRKDVGGLQTYTFDILGQISKGEYDRLLKEGNDMQKESVKMSTE